MTKKTAVPMRNRTFNGKEPLSIVAFLQNFKAACDARNVHEGAAMWLFEHYLNRPVESVINARFALPAETARAQNGCLTSYFAIINWLLKRYEIDKNITIVDTDIRAYK